MKKQCLLPLHLNKKAMSIILVLLFSLVFHSSESEVAGGRRVFLLWGGGMRIFALATENEEVFGVFPSLSSPPSENFSPPSSSDRYVKTTEKEGVFDIFSNESQRIFNPPKIASTGAFKKDVFHSEEEIKGVLNFETAEKVNEDAAKSTFLSENDVFSDEEDSPIFFSVKETDFDVFSRFFTTNKGSLNRSDLGRFYDEISLKRRLSEDSGRLEYGQDVEDEEGKEDEDEEGKEDEDEPEEDIEEEARKEEEPEEDSMKSFVHSDKLLGDLVEDVDISENFKPKLFAFEGETSAHFAAEDSTARGYRKMNNWDFFEETEAFEWRNAQEDDDFGESSVFDEQKNRMMKTHTSLGAKKAEKIAWLSRASDMFQDVLEGLEIDTHSGDIARQLKLCALIDSRCQNLLAEFYYLGFPSSLSLGTRFAFRRDTTTAVLLWKFAADNGNADAQYSLGILYASIFNFPNIYPLGGGCGESIPSTFSGPEKISSFTPKDGEATASSFTNTHTQFSPPLLRNNTLSPNKVICKFPSNEQLLRLDENGEIDTSKLKQLYPIHLLDDLLENGDQNFEEQFTSSEGAAEPPKLASVETPQSPPTPPTSSIPPKKETLPTRSKLSSASSSPPSSDPNSPPSSDPNSPPSSDPNSPSPHTHTDASTTDLLTDTSSQEGLNEVILEESAPPPREGYRENGGVRLGGFPNQMGGKTSELNRGHAKGVVPPNVHNFFYRNEPVSLAYIYASSLAGHPGGLMAMGYRYEMGLGVNMSCETALSYYLELAKKITLVHSTKVPLAVELIRLSLPGKKRLHQKTHEVDLSIHVANQGNHKLQAAVGKRFLLGIHGFSQNYAKALEFLSKAAAKEHGEAMAMVGYIYALGLGVEKNLDTAAIWFHRSITEADNGSEKENGLGQNGMGYVYFFGTSEFPQDYKKAFDCFLKGAQANVSEAQYNLATLYMTGLGTPISYLLALEWFGRAIEQGHISSAYSLAIMHMNGFGTVRNCPLALKLAKRVCHSGNWVATHIKKAYNHEDSEELDHAAFDLLRLSEAGFEHAQSLLATILDKGLSDIMLTHTRSLQRMYASIFFEMAAQQGSIAAKLRLGDFAYYGWGLEHVESVGHFHTPILDPNGEDIRPMIPVVYDMYVPQKASYKTAVERYEEVSNIDPRSDWAFPHIIRAYHSLGYMYLFGIGVNQNIETASELYDRMLEVDPNTPKAPVYFAKLMLACYKFYQISLPKAALWFILNNRLILLILTLFCMTLLLTCRNGLKDRIEAEERDVQAFDDPPSRRRERR